MISLTKTSCVFVHKQKYDGRTKSEWEGELLPLSNEEWIVVRHHPERHRKFVSGKIAVSDRLFLHCLNRDKPLTVLLEFDLEGSFRGAKCDAALPATIDAGKIEFVDLDLDVIVAADLSFFLRDEDTFARNRERMGYSEVVVQQALEGVRLAQELIQSRQFPLVARFIPRLEDDLA